MFNKKQIKEEFKKEKVKIGNKAINKFIEIESKKAKEDIKRFARNANLSGRKVVRKEDIN